MNEITIWAFRIFAVFCFGYLVGYWVAKNEST